MIVRGFQSTIYTLVEYVKCNRLVYNEEFLFFYYDMHSINMNFMLNKLFNQQPCECTGYMNIESNAKLIRE